MNKIKKYINVLDKIKNKWSNNYNCLNNKKETIYPSFSFEKISNSFKNNSKYLNEKVYWNSKVKMRKIKCIIVEY